MPSLDRVFRALLPLLLFLVGVIAPGGCNCNPPEPPPKHLQRLPVCRARSPESPPPPSGPAGTPTVSAGSMSGSFSVSSTGEAVYAMPLASVPGRAGVEPKLAITYDSAAGNGLLGVGFSIAGLSAISRCASNLAQDGRIRGVRYDATDKLCLDGKRLIPVSKAPGTIEYRTMPDTFVKVIAHYDREEDMPGNAVSFEVHQPSGLIVDYGKSESSKPLTPDGAARA